MNMFGNLGGTLSPLVIGFALERFGSWRVPLFTVAALYLVAAVLWLGIDPTRRITLAEPAATPERPGATSYRRGAGGYGPGG
jgi:MFS family permease